MVPPDQVVNHLFSRFRSLQTYRTAVDLVKSRIPIIVTVLPVKTVSVSFRSKSHAILATHLTLFTLIRKLKEVEYICEAFFVIFTISVGLANFHEALQISFVLFLQGHSRELFKFFEIVQRSRGAGSKYRHVFHFTPNLLINFHNISICINAAGLKLYFRVNLL